MAARQLLRGSSHGAGTKRRVDDDRAPRREHHVRTPQDFCVDLLREARIVRALPRVLMDRVGGLDAKNRFARSVCLDDGRAQFETDTLCVRSTFSDYTFRIFVMDSLPRFTSSPTTPAGRRRN